MTTTNKELIKLSDLRIVARLRVTNSEVESHITRLADSITRFGGFPHGLLQPPIVDGDNYLQDGWCRVMACKQLGWTEIPIYRRDALSVTDYQEIELETNIIRLNFTWQENVRGVCKIHRARRLNAVSNNQPQWTREMTGELIGYSKQYIDNCMNICDMLDTAEGWEKLKDCDGITAAVRILLREKEDALVRIKASRMALKPVITPDFIEQLLADDDTIAPPVATSSAATTDQIIDLSNTLLLGDSIRDVLPKWPPDSIDHCICDPPYGIDVEMLQQATTALMDVTRVAEEHTVEENLDLISLMFPAVYRVLKPGGFFCSCCDIMNWQHLYDSAVKAGFRVQRWPIVWVKTSPCKNQMAYHNTTKNIEFVIVCSKQGIIPKPVLTSVITCANDEGKLSNPFYKPFDFWRMLYEWFTTEGQTVLDPFAGEGSSVISGGRLNRRVIAIEKTKHHYDYLVTNLKDHWTKVFNGKVKFV